jgi:hypothetical protein
MPKQLFVKKPLIGMYAQQTGRKRQLSLWQSKIIGGEVLLFSQ